MSRFRRTPRRAVVEQDARLEILACLHSAEPMSIDQVCSRTGLHPTQAKHHLLILDAFGLVRDKGGIEDQQPLYVTRLRQSPAWVTRAVNRHRHAAAE